MASIDETDTIKAELYISPKVLISNAGTPAYSPGNL